jgi:hypothetical protein
VTVDPAGAGRVVDVSGLQQPGGALIACPDRCTAELEIGARIDLGARADEGSMFVGWGVDTCPAAATCTLAASTDVTLLPRFEAVVELTVELLGAQDREPRVTVDVGETTPIPLLEFDPDEPCSDRCTYRLPAGTGVTLTAKGSDEWPFDAWDPSAVCDGTVNPCVVTVQEDLTVTARFAQQVVFNRPLPGDDRVGPG